MTNKICGIVGYPLKKPRSIKIWKKYFRENNIKASMKKFEVSKKKLDNFIRFMKFNEKFLATAITMPYKITLFEKVKINDEFAKYAKSINLIIKKNSKLYGYNTDVYGALYSIKNNIKFYKEIIIIGLGGTGRAIFNYLSKKYKNKSFIIISSKKIKKTKNVRILKKINKNLFNKKQLIINCTPIGSNLKEVFLKQTPIPINFIKYINKKSFIFDIIYSPKTTLLNKHCKKYCLNYKNGLLMNTIQAAKALKLVSKNLKYEKQK